MLKRVRRDPLAAAARNTATDDAEFDSDELIDDADDGRASNHNRFLHRGHHRVTATQLIKNLNGMPLNVRRRIYALRALHRQALSRVREHHQRANDRLALEFQATNKCLVGARERIVQGIPQFWLHVLRHYEPTAVMVTPRDAEVLHFLADVTSTFVDGCPSKGYELHFHFAQNKFFTDDVLTKRYFIDDFDEGPNRTVGCTIHWTSPQNNVTLRVRSTKRSIPAGRNKKRGAAAAAAIAQAPVYSFFNYFTYSSGDEEWEDEEEGDGEPRLTDRRIQRLQETDLKLGQAFDTFVIPRAVFIYTGQHIEDVLQQAGSDDGSEGDRSGCGSGDHRGHHIGGGVCHRVQHDADGDDSDDSGEINPVTLMHRAAGAGRTDAVLALLRSGVPVDIANHDGEAPLHAAAHRGRLEVCKVLLKHGANADACCASKSTPLHFAAVQGHATVVQLLLKHRSNCSSRDEDGSAPLAKAAYAVSPACVKLLLAAGALPTDADDDGDTAVHALFYKLCGVFDDEDGDDVSIAADDDTDETGCEPLTEAEGETVAAFELRVKRQKALHRGIIVLELLVKAGADPMRQNNDGEAPMFNATTSDSLVPHLPPFLKVMLDAGADPNAKSNDGRTFASIVAGSNAPEMLAMLLARGADVLAVDNNGYSPLMHAAYALSYNCAKILLGVSDVIRSEREREGPNAWNTAFFQACHVEGESDDEDDDDEEEGSASTTSNGDHIAVTRLPEPVRNAILEKKLAKLLEIADLLLPCNFSVNRQLHGVTPLLAAATEDALHPAVRLVAAQGAEMNLRDKTGTTALLMACINHAEQNALFLIEHGADGSLADEDGDTPLLQAAREGLLKTVRALLAHGASVTVVSNEHRSVLHYALDHLGDESLQGKDGPAEEEKVLTVIKECVSLGANVNATDESHATPMHYAAHAGSVHAMQLLHELGGHVMPGTCPNDPLIFAVKKAALPAVECLLQLGANPQGRDASRFGPGPSALHHAANVGNLPIVEALLRAGADVLAKDDDGATALARAASENHTNLIQPLVAAGTPIDGADNDGDTALHCAAGSGHPEAVALLLSLGASLTVRNSQGNTALVQAAWSCCPPVLKAMLDNGCAVDARDNDGDALLAVVCHSRLTRHNGEARASGEDPAGTVRLLLSRGANVNDRGSGPTPLHIVASMPDDPISEQRAGENVTLLRLLLSPLNTPVADVNSRDAEGMAPLHRAARQRNLAGAMLLVAAGADINARDSDDQTPLHAAVVGSGQRGIRHSVGITGLLLQEGAEVDNRSAVGNTPLLVAAARGNLPVVELLHRYGASIFSRNLTMASALHLAAYHGQVGVTSWLLAEPQVVAQLLEARDESGATPAHRAAMRGQTPCLDLLSGAGADLDAVDSPADRNTVMHHAAGHAAFDCVRHCLRWGADHLCVDGRGATPLLRAARSTTPGGFAGGFGSASSSMLPRTTTALLLVAAVQRCEDECFGPVAS